MERVKQSAEEILTINQDAMVRKSDRVRRIADQMIAFMIVAAVGTAVLGILLSITLTHRMLRPLSVLTQAVHRIGEGDLEVRAHVEGTDEIAQLANEFNTMTDHLNRYRRSSPGALLQAQQMSQAAIDSLPDPIIVLGVEGEVIHVNRAAEALLGVTFSPKTVDLFRNLPPELKATMEGIRRHVFGGKGAYQPRGFEEAVRVPSSEGDRFFLPRANPLYREEGDIIGVTVLLQEVTRLRRFDELKNDLVATVAHEFRTPLTSLRMAIHLCLDETVGTLTEKQADRVGAATYFLLHLMATSLVTLVYVLVALRLSPPMTGLVFLCGYTLQKAVYCCRVGATMRRGMERRSTRK